MDEIPWHQATHEYTSKAADPNQHGHEQRSSWGRVSMMLGLSTLDHPSQLKQLMASVLTDFTDLGAQQQPCHFP